jgi:hypothetical protein
VLLSLAKQPPKGGKRGLLCKGRRKPLGEGKKARGEQETKGKKH